MATREVTPEEREKFFPVSAQSRGFVYEEEGVVKGYAGFITNGEVFFGHDLYTTGSVVAACNLIQKLRKTAKAMNYKVMSFHIAEDYPALKKLINDGYVRVTGYNVEMDV